MTSELQASSRRRCSAAAERSTGASGRVATWNTLSLDSTPRDTAATCTEDGSAGLGGDDTTAARRAHRDGVVAAGQQRLQRHVGVGGGQRVTVVARGARLVVRHLRRDDDTILIPTYSENDSFRSRSDKFWSHYCVKFISASSSSRTLYSSWVLPSAGFHHRKTPLPSSVSTERPCRFRTGSGSAARGERQCARDGRRTGGGGGHSLSVRSAVAGHEVTLPDMVLTVTE